MVNSTCFSNHTTVAAGTEHAPLTSEESQDEAFNHSSFYVAAKGMLFKRLSTGYKLIYYL